MLRLLLIGVVLLLVLVGGLAVGLTHFFGWKGLIAFPFILLIVVWLAKLLIKKLIKGFFLKLFSMKSSVLRGAGLVVHSVTPVAEPLKRIPKSEPDSDESEAGEVGGAEGEPAKLENDDEKSAGTGAESKEPKQYYAVELTITPKEKVRERFWEPGELILASERIKSLEDLEGGEKELGTACDVLVWSGTAYTEDDPGKYPGEQRLKIVFAVKPGTAKAWLHYYSECLGPIDLPAWAPALAA